MNEWTEFTFLLVQVERQHLDFWTKRMNMDSASSFTKYPKTNGSLALTMMGVSAMPNSRLQEEEKNNHPQLVGLLSVKMTRERIGPI